MRSFGWWVLPCGTVVTCLLLLLLPPMGYGFVPLLLGPTATAMGTPKRTALFKIRTAIKTKRLRSNEKGKNAEETEEKPVRQKWERADDKSDLLFQTVIESLRIANESVRNAETKVKKWDKLVRANVPYYICIFKECKEERDKANERLKGANERLKERLKEARDLYLQLTQSC